MIKNDKLFLSHLHLAVSAVVFLLVVALNKRLIEPPSEFPEHHLQVSDVQCHHQWDLFRIYLLLSLRAIKQKKIALHKNLNITTFLLSAVFLMLYVVYHFFVTHTAFGGEGATQNRLPNVILGHRTLFLLHLYFHSFSLRSILV